jgi:transcriptional regulator with XRE-family HTH domain
MQSTTSPDRFVRRTLRPRRERLGLSQSAVAKLTGFSTTHVAVVENGGNASAKAVRVVNAALVDLETALAFYEPDVDVTALIERINELETKVDLLESDRAEYAAQLETAGRALLNGHADVGPDEPALFNAEAYSVR